MSTTPPPYDRQADFTTFHTPQAPTVGQGLEAEFNKLNQVLDATQARLAEIQRDDGKLANGSVIPDALSDSVKAMMGGEASQQIVTDAEVARDAAQESASAAALSESAAAGSAALAEAARLLGAQIGYATKADMDADLAHADGTLALVTNDSNASNNVTYRKSGAVGTGSWVQSADRVSTLKQDFSGLSESYSYSESKAKMEKNREALGVGLPKAAVVILLGQSLNVSRGTKVLGKSWPGAKMFVNAVAVSEFDFFAANNEHSTNWTSVASAVDLAEGVGQSPCVGIAATIGGGKFTRAYLCSVAVGSRQMYKLMSGGLRCNLYAAVHRFCDIARADGFDPIVMFYSAHGEADATSATGEANYYSLGMSYYRMAQLVAAQAMEKPDYIAPVFLTYPVQQKEGDNDRAIKEAIRRISVDLPGAVNLGGIYQWPCNTDRIHPTEGSYVKRGEMVGRAMRSYFEDGKKWGAIHVTDVTLNGTEFVATFSAPVIRDATLGVGSNLNTSAAKDGFEWLDNGVGIAITALSYEGWKVRGTLASTPSGAIEQQVLRIAEQTTTATSIAGVSNLPGSLVREDAAGWKSVLDYAYTNYNWASPQKSSVRSL